MGAQTTDDKNKQVDEKSNNKQVNAEENNKEQEKKIIENAQEKEEAKIEGEEKEKKEQEITNNLNNVDQARKEEQKQENKKTDSANFGKAAKEFVIQQAVNGEMINEKKEEPVKKESEKKPEVNNSVDNNIKSEEKKSVQKEDGPKEEKQEAKVDNRTPAEKFYDSLVNVLKEQGVDINFPPDAQQFVELSGESNNPNYNPFINLLAPNLKDRLLEAAKSGKLALFGADFSIDSLRSIVVNKDGEAVLSLPVTKLPNYVEELDRAEKELNDAKAAILSIKDPKKQNAALKKTMEDHPEYFDEVEYWKDNVTLGAERYDALLRLDDITDLARNYTSIKNQRIAQEKAEIKSNDVIKTTWINAFREEYNAHKSSYPDYQSISDGMSAFKAAYELEASKIDLNQLKKDPSLCKPFKGLDVIEKTITDMYKGNAKEAPDIYEVIKGGFICDSEGNPFKLDPKNPKGSLEQIANYLSTAEKNMSDTPLYCKLPAKDNNGVSLVAVYKKGDILGKRPEDPNNGDLVLPHVRQAALKEIREIKKAFEEINKSGKNNSQSFNELVEECDNVEKRIMNDRFKGKFNKDLEDFAQKADQFYFEKTGQKRQPRREQKMNAAARIRRLADAVKNDKIPDKPDPLNDKRRTLAAKCVKTFADACRDSEDPEKKAMAEKINNSLDEFNKAIDDAIKSPGFQSLFGGKDKKTEDLIENALNANGKDLLQAVHGRQHSMDMEEVEKARQQERMQKAQNRQKGPVTEDTKDYIIGSIQKFKQGMDNAGYMGRNPQYNKLKNDLDVLNLQLQYGARYVNFREELGKLAQTADNIYKEGLLNDNWRKDAEVFNIASEIRDLDSCVSTDQDPRKKMLSDKDRILRDSASRVVEYNSRKLANSELREQREKGVKILKNRKEFDKAVEKMLKEPAFRELVKERGNDLVSLLKDDPADISKDLGTREKEIKAKKELEQKLKKEAEKVKEQKKEDPNKKKEEVQKSSLNK